MKVDYQILSFHKPTAGIQVKYFNEDIPSGVVFSLNLPVIDAKLPQGQALEDFVMAHCPYQMFEQAAALRDATLPTEMEGLPSPTHAALENLMEGQFFVREGGERIFLVRPLVQMHALDIPLEII